jgi:hypothetical protein
MCLNSDWQSGQSAVNCRELEDAAVTKANQSSQFFVASSPDTATGHDRPNIV